jgi:DeoR family suf operon transcriptional repressor
MNPISRGLAGLRGLRGEILLELKKSQPLTASDLAATFAVSANAVRRHLKELEVEELVAYGREQRGSGAPTYAFRLTKHGEALFPKQYGDALKDVLDFVAESQGRDEVQRIFADRFKVHTERLRVQLAGATLEERLQAVTELLSNQGYMAEWSEEDGTLLLTEHNCAVKSAAEWFPEICAAEAEFLQDILETNVQRDMHISQGCNSCLYSIDMRSALPEASAQRGKDEEPQ